VGGRLVRPVRGATDQQRPLDVSASVPPWPIPPVTRFTHIRRATRTGPPGIHGHHTARPSPAPAPLLLSDYHMAPNEGRSLIRWGHAGAKA
jgi:hypothetical protein